MSAPVRLKAVQVDEHAVVQGPHWSAAHHPAEDRIAVVEDEIRIVVVSDGPGMLRSRLEPKDHHAAPARTPEQRRSSNAAPDTTGRSAAYTPRAAAASWGLPAVPIHLLCRRSGRCSCPRHRLGSVGGAAGSTLSSPRSRTGSPPTFGCQGYLGEASRRAALALANDVKAVLVLARFARDDGIRHDVPLWT
jgi:hypothetical protein